MSSDYSYGSPSGANNSTIEYAENAIVNGVSAKKVFPVELPPTAQTNPSVVISSDDPVVATTKTITKTIGATSYTKTLSYNAAGELISVSVWS